VFSNPKDILEKAYIGDGMHVADIGAGSGHYAFLISDMVGDNGQVYAVDVQQDLLTKIKNEVTAKHRKNVGVILADAEREGGTGIAPGTIDRVLFANSLFQFDDKEGAAKEAKRLLKRTGRVIVVDWTDSFSSMGPHKDHVFGKDAAVKLFLKAGFDIEREVPAGDHHYGLILKLQS